MIKFKNFLIVSAILIIVSTLFTIILVKSNNSNVLVNGTVLSNKKIGWGLKREKDQKQPDLTTYLNIVTKYGAIGIGDSKEKVVYLTFDEGYEAGYTEKILQILKENNVKACFFITAHYLNSKSELVKQMLDDGHILGNHTVNHYSMPEIDDLKIKEEILGLHRSVYEQFGYEMKYIRPPKGEFSERTVSITQNLGYTTVFWSLAYDDYDEKNQKGDEYAKEKIINNIHPGAIILLHGNSKNNCDVLDYCIKEIKNMGYEFKNLNEFK